MFLGQFRLIRIGQGNETTTKMKIIEIDNSARLKMYTAINKAGDRVRSTYGPAGLNTLIGKKFVIPSITNDGLQTIKSLEYEDEVEDAVVRVMESGMQTVNDLAGDNRTLTGILIQEIFNAGYRCFYVSESLIKKIINPQVIKKEIDEIALLVLSEIKKAKQIESLEDIQKVAFVATENKEYAELIAKTVFEVGKDGVIKVEESDALGMEVHISEGMEIISGMFHRDMATNGKLESIIENPFILVCSEKIHSYGELTSIAQELAQRNIKDLVIFAPDFDRTVINTFNRDRAQEIFRVLAIKTSPWDKGLNQDICSVSGSTIIDGSNQIFFNDLGQVDKIISNSETTTLIGGRKDKQGNIDLLKEELKIVKSPFEKQKLEERIARISGKVALIEVGALTEIDRKRLNDKIQDGVRATQGALEEGVLPGGGLALIEIANNIPNNMLSEALRAPSLQIQKNSGELKIGEDIIDSAKSLRIAVQTACNIAGNLLTVGTISVEKNEKHSEQDN